MLNDVSTYLSKLEGDLARLDSEVSVLRGSLTELTARRNDVAKAIEVIQRIEGITAPSDVEVDDVVDVGQRSGPLEQPEFSETIIESHPSVVKARPSIKRIRSTEMMSELVLASDRKWTREGLHEEFERVYGIPESWKTPQNALNNAIGRAVDRGLIVQDGGRLPVRLLLHRLRRRWKNPKEIRCL